MIKKKTMGKAAAKKSAKKKSASKPPKTKKQTNPAEVRQDIARIVGSGAKKIAKAVMDQAMTGQLAPAKYLFEVAGVYPPATDAEQGNASEDCFAKTLMHRLNLPDEPIAHDEEDEMVRVPTPVLKAEDEEGAGDDESTKKSSDGQEPDAEAEAAGAESRDPVSAR